MFHSSSSSCSDCSAATPAINVSTLHGYFDANAPSFPPTLLPSSPPYSSSLPPYYYLPRSSSTHSLPLHHHNHSSDPFNPLPFSAPHKRQYQQPPLALGPVLTSSSLPSSSRDFIDFNAGPVRRVFSTGDLQGLNGTLSSGDNYNQDGGTIPGRVGRYSAEERKERVERYRSKRNQRNFQKKITYACRKTLADSRPRVRGRFARNGETEAEAEAEVEENNYVCYSHNSCEQTQNRSGVGNGNDWLRQMQAALGADEEDERFNEEDLWATISDAFLVNHLD